MSDDNPQELLGRREDWHLEFKDAEVLRRPVKVAREVVGFLNADGGDVWIGVKEGDQGRAVELQTLDRPEMAKRSILDHLIGVIEPSFSQDEVAVTCVGGLIQVAVKQGAHPPYAVRDGGRHFLIRVDNRLNEMTREQIREAFSQERSIVGQDLSAIKSRLRGGIIAQALEKEGQLWLALYPTEDLDIHFSESTKQSFRTLFSDPRATGNRRGGWNFVADPILRRPRFLGDHLAHGEDSDRVKTTINSHGELIFVVGLSALSNIPVSSNQFVPYALLEYPVSAFRLMSRLLKDFGKNPPGAKVVAACSMKGFQGWTLSPGSPKYPTGWPGPKVLEQDDLQIDPERLVFDAKRLIDEPDRCALQLVRLVYGELGFEDDAIPREFDQDRGVLSIA